MGQREVECWRTTKKFELVDEWEMPDEFVDGEEDLEFTCSSV